MLFITKVLTQLAYPLFQSFMLSILALFLLLIGRLRLACISLALAITVTWIFATPAISNALRASLEMCYPPISIEEHPEADVIVILGGALFYPVPPRLEVELTDPSDRVLYAARLYRAGKAPLILASGGKLPWLQGGGEAIIIKDLLVEWGVPTKAVLTETSSRTTRENALYIRELLERHGFQRILLVTSAMHMPRAMATFSNLDIAVIPATTDITVVDKLNGNILDWLPTAGALQLSSMAIKEYLGIWVYRLRGW